LQLILLKVALICGCNFIENISFIEICPLSLKKNEENDKNNCCSCFNLKENRVKSCRTEKKKSKYFMNGSSSGSSEDSEEDSEDSDEVNCECCCHLHQTNKNNDKDKEEDKEDKEEEEPFGCFAHFALSTAATTSTSTSTAAATANQIIEESLSLLNSFELNILMVQMDDVFVKR